VIKVVLKLIAFFGVCLLFTGWLAFTIGNIKLFQDNYELTATFDDVTGLLRNDNVKVAGVPVGKVTGVSIEKGRAKVTFTVKDEVRVPSDSSAAVRWRNLLGQRYLYLYPGEASTALRDGDAVGETQSVVDLGELFNRLGPIVRALEPEKVNQFLDTITAALDGNETKLRQAIADLATLTKGLASRDAAIGRLIENANTVAGAIDARDAQIRTVLDNLLAVTTTFSEHAGVLDQASVELSSFSRDFGGLLDDNAAQIDNTIVNLRRIVDVVREKLPTLDRALGNLDEGTQAIFRSAMYGEWLNQTIPCGRISGLSIDAAYIKGSQDIPPHVAPPAVGVAGGDGLAQLFGSLAGAGATP
jgi:phospholipid/cholesterol/gamma-HCH transport system substrate-binding protein